MENTFLNLRRGQFLNLFPVNLPCRCQAFSNPRYNIELEYRVDHAGKWVDYITIECKNCGSSIKHNVFRFKVSTKELKF
ncbi:MAG: hypothetical protein E7311_07195 [Clostridiales bacterium]|nr:hypothetical protein [Clostridiales bacterium]